MPRYVTPEVRQELSDPDREGSMRLALVIQSGEVETIRERAREYGVTIDRELPSGVLLVSCPLEAGEQFIETEAIESVTKPDRMKTLS